MLKKVCIINVNTDYAITLGKLDRKLKEVNCKTNIKYDTGDIQEMFKAVETANVLVVVPFELSFYSEYTSKVVDASLIKVIEHATHFCKKIIVVPTINPEQCFGLFFDKKFLAPALRNEKVVIAQPEFKFSKNGAITQIVPVPWEKLFELICEDNLLYANQTVVLPKDTKERVRKMYKDIKAMAVFIEKKKESEDYDCPSSDFIAVKDNKGGIIVTCYKEQFVNLKKENLVYISEWENDQIHWAGSNKPCYQLPLIVDLFKNYKNAKVIVSAGFRRVSGSNFISNEYASKQYVIAGNAGEWQKISYNLENHFGIAVIKNNNVVIVDNNYKTVKEKLTKILNEVNNPVY